MTLNKSVFVIIITDNPKKWVEKCLNSLINSTLLCKIIVIDNVGINKLKFNTVYCCNFWLFFANWFYQCFALQNFKEPCG